MSEARQIPSHTVPTEHQEHASVGAAEARRERATRRVIALTVVTMVAEIAAGQLFNSMALLADGWHMGSHAAALGITAFAYSYARRHSGNERYAFGTWKVGALGGFTSAVALGFVAVLLAWESLSRLLEPAVIAFDEAIVVAVLGLLVNLVSAFMLSDHGHEHSGDGAADHNLRAAYVHVLTDALTSVLAIVALTAGKFAGWVWMDPLMGIVGAAIIARWSLALVRDTSRVLLDSDVEPGVAAAVRHAIESHDDNQVVDLHLWRVGPRGLSAIISVATHHPRPPEYYKQLVADVFDLTHVTIEVHRCSADDCA
jgi:cation diffusion facilitator family transporter